MGAAALYAQSRLCVLRTFEGAQGVALRLWAFAKSRVHRKRKAVAVPAEIGAPRLSGLHKPHASYTLNAAAT
jgi:hypothetical protein